MQERYSYSAYGTPVFLDSSFTSRTSSDFAWETLYAGYRYDAPTGLYAVRNRVYHPTLGCWLTRDPAGYRDGMDLYQYGHSEPIAYADPLGLWRWYLDLKGRIMVRSESGDNGQDLVNQRYPADMVLKKLKQSDLCDCRLKSEKPNLATRLRAGCVLDVSEVVPTTIRKSLARQQTMPFDREMRSFYSRSVPFAPDFSTVGEAIHTFVLPASITATGTYLSPVSSYRLGFSNCYVCAAQCAGSLNLCFGRQVDPWNIMLAETAPNTRIAGHSQTIRAPGVYRPSAKTVPPELNAIVYAPEGGIEHLLIGKRTPTKRPSLGAIAMFSNNDGQFTHAAFVLGRSRQGRVYILQKLNQCQAYYISTVQWAVEQRRFGTPSYYQ